MDDTQYLLNNLMYLMTQKIYVPSDFHSRVQAVKEMQDNDVTGLVDSLTDFQVQSASVEYSVETSNDELTKIYKKWLENINKDYNGKIPSGINPLAEEYFKERWKYSGLSVLNIAKWEVDPKSKLLLPSKMFFLDGGSIYAEDKDPANPALGIDQYNYFLGQNMEKKYLLKDNVIFNKANARWQDEYPNPNLIKRGIYYNWRIIEAIKRNEIDVLDQVIPYLFVIKKNTEKLMTDKGRKYSDEKLTEVITKFEELVNKVDDDRASLKGKSTPIRASEVDEELKHLIPDLEALFKTVLFEQAEKNILAGMGFIDIVDGATSTRRESNLNPKPFIQEVQTGVSAFKQIMKDLFILIQEKNKEHSKYMNVTHDITSTPIKGFMTDKFKERVRQLWDRGLISSKTCVEMGIEVDFEVEVQRRENEAKDGTDLVMYPHITENKEDKGFDVVGQSTDEVDDSVPDGKTDPIEKKNFDKASLHNPLAEEMELIGSPYASVKDLPKSVATRIKGIDKRRAWLRIFNSAYNYYMGKFGSASRAESLAFATANTKIKDVNLKPKKKVKEEKKPDKAQLENETVDKEIKQKQNSLLDKLLGRGNKE